MTNKPPHNKNTSQQTHRRRDAARQLFHSDSLKESVALAPSASMRNNVLTGVQTALTAVLAITLFHFSEWPHLVGFAGLGALAILFGRFEPRLQRSKILFLASLMQTTTVLIMSTAGWLQLPIPLQLGLLSLMVGVLVFICSTTGLWLPGPLIFVFAAGASIAPELSGTDVIERTLATGATALFGWLICIATALFRQVPGPNTNFPPIPPLQPVNERLAVAARITLGAALAIFISHYLFDAHYPAWAGMGTLAVMQGAYLHLNMSRALQRMVGTTIGAVMAWAVLQQQPTIWELLAVIAVFQVLTEIFIGMNYAIGQMFVAPMALLMTYLAAPHLVGDNMVPERVLDTLTGASIGVAIAVLLSTLDDRRHLSELRNK